MNPTAQKNSIYRLTHSAEIQALRAIAVTLVLFYHVDSALLPNGFVGVDIFFVLSGFLIGRKLLAELDENGQIDILAFTAARAKRLLPNACLVLLTVAVATYLFLPSYRTAGIAADIRSAALFVSNIHFSTNAVDYLQIGTPPSPILHFWSLSIEEQFYIGIPALLWVIARYLPRQRITVSVWVIILLAVTSFAAGALALQTSQPEAFFGTQYRIWQLATGVFAGWLSVHLERTTPRSIALILLAGGIYLLAWSLTKLDVNAGYPGEQALIPTLGTAALLLALTSGTKTPLNTALSSPTLQWVGDRSYSIYLWHWPFISIVGANYPGYYSLAWVAALASIVVADIAYRLLEMPIRSKKQIPVSTVGIGAIAALVLVIASSLLLRHAPISKGAASLAAEINKARDDLSEAYTNKCHLDLDEIDHPPCAFGSLTPSSKTVMLFGDSHAAQWFGPLRSAALKNGWTFLSRTKSSCPSIAVTIWYPPKAAVFTACSEWRDRVLREIQADPPDVVVLANYSGYRKWIAEDGSPANDARSVELWQAGYISTLSMLPTKSEVWVVRDIPRMSTDIIDCLSYGESCERSRTDAMARLYDEASFPPIPGRTVHILDMTDEICDETKCHAVIKGKIAYRDDNHITSTFAKSLTHRFGEILELSH